MRWTLPLWVLLPLLVSCSQTQTTPNIAEVALTGPDPRFLPFGAIDLVIDADNVSLGQEHRGLAAAGEALTIDLSTFMRAENSLRLEGIRRIDPTTIGLTIAIRHPVPLPPEGKEPKFHATDVLGVFLFDGSQAMDFTDSSGNQPTERVVPGWVEADGYTGMLNASFLAGFPSSCTMHPYVVLSEDTRTPNYDPNSERGWIDVRNPIGFNVLPQGADWRSTEAILKLPPGQHRVRLAVQGTIQEIPLFDGGGNPIPARYCYPEGSLQAAWKLETQVWNPGLYAGAPAGNVCEVDVIAHDWQHGSQLPQLPYSAEDHKDLVRVPSQANFARLLAPALDAEMISGTQFQYYATRDEPFSSTYHVTNKNNAPAGFHWGLAVVYDARDAIRLFDAAAAELPIAGYPPHRAGQVVQIPVAPSTVPDFITKLEVAPLDRVFLAEGDARSFLPEAVWASGARTPVAPSAGFLKFNHEFWPTRVAVEETFTLRRLVPRDTSDWLRIRILPLDPATRVRATTLLYLSSPYPTGAGLWGHGGSGSPCGGSTDPTLVFGGPRGAGTAAGNTDHVVSLGYDGVLSLQMTNGYILDKPGPDFIVFENAFEIGQNPGEIFTETVRVEVSQDQQNWVAFPMDYRPDGPLPWRNPANFSGMAGVTPVLANVDENDIDPTDPTVAGGDAFDLADVGLAWASFVRLSATGIDASSPCFSGCPESTRMTDADGDLIDDEGKHGTCSGTVGGPDIDAVAIVKGHQGFPE